MNGIDARTSARHLHTIPVHVGARMPAYVNSMGRVLPTELDDTDLDEHVRHAELRKLNRYTVTSETALRRILQDIRKNGYSMLEHELHEGRRATTAFPPDPPAKRYRLSRPFFPAAMAKFSPADVWSP